MSISSKAKSNCSRVAKRTAKSNSSTQLLIMEAQETTCKLTVFIFVISKIMGPTRQCPKGSPKTPYMVTRGHIWRAIDKLWWLGPYAFFGQYRHNKGYYDDMATLLELL